MTKDSGDLAIQHSSCNRYSAQSQRPIWLPLYIFYKTYEY